MKSSRIINETYNNISQSKNIRAQTFSTPTLMLDTVKKTNRTDEGDATFVQNNRKSEVKNSNLGYIQVKAMKLICLTHQTGMSAFLVYIYYNFWFYQTLPHQCQSGSKVKLLNRFCHHIATLAILKVVFVIYFLLTKQEVL